MTEVGPLVDDEGNVVVYGKETAERYLASVSTKKHRSPGSDCVCLIRGHSSLTNTVVVGVSSFPRGVWGSNSHEKSVT